MSPRKSRIDRLIERIKRNPIVSVSIVVGTVVIALSSFTDAAKNLVSVATRQSPEEARADLSRMSVEYSPESLVSKAEDADVVAVRLLLRAGIDPDAHVDGDYGTALIAATAKGHRSIVEALLAAHADVNAANDEGVTALMRAARYGDVGIVRTLLDGGAGVNQDDQSGDGAMSYAAVNGHLEIVETLLDAGAHGESINSALADALTYAHTDIARLLMDRGGDVKKVGADALRRAIRRDNINHVFGNGVRFVLSLDFDINGQNAQGFAPVHEAASEGNAAIVKALLGKGATVDLVCECDGYFSAKNWTPLQMAAMAGSAETIEILVAAGANVRYANTRLATTLHLVDRSDKRVLQLLIDKGADVNARDIDGRTPIMKLSGDDPERSQILLDNGADINARDSKGWTPLMHDAYSLRAAPTRLLLARKVDVNARNTAGQTALMLAAGRGAVDVVRTLLNANARVQEKDLDGKTALDYATDGDSPDAAQVIRLLRQRGARQ